MPDPFKTGSVLLRRRKNSPFGFLRTCPLRLFCPFPFGYTMHPYVHVGFRQHVRREWNEETELETKYSHGKEVEQDKHTEVFKGTRTMACRLREKEAAINTRPFSSCSVGGGEQSMYSG
eukprot:Hpha_TRINITY_DN15996_c1_g6::TRINITY_DN15996_c1_g6_i6::g.74436::m.74436